MNSNNNLEKILQIMWKKKAFIIGKIFKRESQCKKNF